jgi:hypothetical protein
MFSLLLLLMPLLRHGYFDKEKVGNQLTKEAGGKLWLGQAQCNGSL